MAIFKTEEIRIMENKEFEIKLRVTNAEILLNWLRTHASFLQTSQQTDIYYNPPHKNFVYLKNGKRIASEYIRVRIDKNGSSLCYKYIDKELEQSGPVSIDEIETKVENPQKVITILEKAGFKAILSIKKNRASYIYQDFQIDYDQVDDLGEFVEIEYHGSESDTKEIFSKINRLVAIMNLNKSPHAKGGYVELMLNK